MAKTLYTKAEAAEELSISVSQLEKPHRAGEITYTRIGARGTRVHADEIRSFAASLPTF